MIRTKCLTMLTVISVFIGLLTQVRAFYNFENVMYQSDLLAIGSGYLDEHNTISICVVGKLKKNPYEDALSSYIDLLNFLNYTASYELVDSITECGKDNNNFLYVKERPFDRSEVKGLLTSSFQYSGFMGAIPTYEIEKALIDGMGVMSYDPKHKGKSRFALVGVMFVSVDESKIDPVDIIDILIEEVFQVTAGVNDVPVAIQGVIENKQQLLSTAHEQYFRNAQDYEGGEFVYLPSGGYFDRNLNADGLCQYDFIHLSMRSKGYDGGGSVGGFLSYLVSKLNYYYYTKNNSIFDRRCNTFINFRG